MTSPQIRVLIGALAIAVVGAIFMATGCGSREEVAKPATKKAEPPPPPTDGPNWLSFRGDPALTGTAPHPLARDLRQYWRFEAGSPINSTAAIRGNHVYVGTEDGRLLCLSLDKGEKVWEFATPKKSAISASPCVVGQSVFVGDQDGTFWAIDAEKGTERWNASTGDKIMSSATPGPAGILVGSYDNNLYCFNPVDGAVVWKFESTAQIHGAPCLNAHGVVIAGCDSSVHLINPADGTEKTAVEANAQCSASPAGAGDVIYIGTLQGDCLAVDIKAGEVIWTIEGGVPENEFGSVTASAAVRDDAVIFGVDNDKVFRANRGTGKVEWSFKTKGKVESSPVIAGDDVFVGCVDGNLYRLSLAKGEALWTFKAGAAITASPAIASDRLIIGTDDGAIYCFGP